MIWFTITPWQLAGLTRRWGEPQDSSKCLRRRKRRPTLLQIVLAAVRLFYRWRAIGDLVGDTLVQFKAFFDSLLRGMLLFRKCLTRAFRCLTADGQTSLKSSEIV